MDIIMLFMNTIMPAYKVGGRFWVTRDCIGLKIENKFNSLFHKHQEITVFLLKVMFFSFAAQKFVTGYTASFCWVFYFRGDKFVRLYSIFVHIKNIN